MFKKAKKSPSTLLNQAEILTIIGEDFELEGSIRSESNVRIEGKITGNVIVQKGVILGEKGNIKGDIESEMAVIYGTVNGNVKVKQLEIKQTGFINGDIKTDTISIEMGAHYNGKLEMKNLLVKELANDSLTKSNPAIKSSAE